MLTTTIIRCKDRIESLKISSKLPAGTVARLLGVTPTTLNNSLRGLYYMGGEREAQLNELTLLLVSLEQAMKPVMLPTDVDSLQRLVDHVRANQITPEKIRANISEIFGVVES